MSWFEYYGLRALVAQGEIMPLDHTVPLPDDTPDEVKERAQQDPRVPKFDPTFEIALPIPDGQPIPKNRLVAIGDSLTHGFQSGAVYNTDLSFPAIIAYELGWLDSYRYPRYGGPGGIPFNLELLLRRLEERFGSTLSWWELPLAAFAARDFMDEVEDYWERGAGTQPPPPLAGFIHDLSVYGWDLRDALSRTYATCSDRIARPKDDLLKQIVENSNFRAALRVYPGQPEDENLTVFDVAERLGDDRDGADCGIETLVVFLGSNNALGAVTGLNVTWSGPRFDDPDANSSYTVWRPEHFKQEFEQVADRVREINARNVIWCNVPHVTIAPIARGVGRKREVGSAYFPYYTRPWIKDEDFDRSRDPHITGDQAHAIDVAIDMYNEVIDATIRRAREQQRNWYLLDVSGLLDRLASRRYISDPNARPDWWTPYPLPPLLASLNPAPDSRFVTGDGHGGRASGGLFSLDGVHPTTIGYGIIAQELINIMRLAGVQFYGANAALRTNPVTVDFTRLLRRDTLVNHPPQNISSSLDVIAWAEETVGWIRQALAW